MIRKVLYITALLVALSLVSFVGLTAFLATEAGSRWLIQHALTHVPPQLTIKAIQGNLVSGLVLTGVELRRASKTIRIQRAELRWRPETLLLGRISLRTLYITQLIFDKPKPSPLPLIEELRSAIGLRLPLSLSVEAARVQRLRINLQGNHYILDRLSLTARADRQGLRLSQSKARYRGLRLNLEGHAELLHPYAFNAVLSWTKKLSQGIRARGKAQLRGNIDVIHLVHDLHSPFTMKTWGEIKLAGESAIANLRGSWRHAQWPLSDKAAYQTQNGRYHITGTPDAYRLSLNGQLGGGVMPTLQVEAQGKGSRSSFLFEHLGVGTLEGKLSASGQLQWSPELRWNLHVNAGQLNPGIQWPAWPGKLSGETNLQGRLKDSIPYISLQKLKLSGQMWRQPLKLEGNLKFIGARMRSDSLRIYSGENRLTLSGELASKLNLIFAIQAPALRSSWPGLKGQLQANGELRGTLSNPDLTLSLQASNLSYQEYALRELRLAITLDPQNIQRSETRIQADQLRLFNTTIPRVLLTGRGNMKRHELQLELTHPRVRANFALSGNYTKGIWNEQLKRASLDLLRYGVWRLQKPVAMQISAGEFKPVTACWVLGSATLCAEGAWNNAQGWRTDVRTDGFPLIHLRHLLPKGLSLEGLLYAHLTASDSGTGLRSKLDIHSQAGEIIYRLAGTNSYNSAYRDFKLSGQVSDDQAQAGFSFALDHGGASGNLLIQPLSNRLESPPLSGRVDVSLTDIAFVNAITPNLKIRSGTLHAGADLTGTLSQPEIHAQATLNNGAVDQLDLGIALTEINLTAQTRQFDLIRFEGSLRSGEGALAIAGQAKPARQGDWSYVFRVRGDELNIVRLPEVYATASPKLTITGRTGGTAPLKITGSVLIPRASIEIKRLPAHAVSVTSDQIIVGETKQASRTKQKSRHKANETGDKRMRIYSDIELTLGKKAEFTGLGLKSGLTGEVRIRGDLPESLVGDGVINLDSGEYDAYGQKLSLEHGRLIFTGPLNDPALDIQAYRRIDEVTAGIIISGTLKAPQTKLYSDPTLSDSQTLAYLLRGKPPSQETDGEGAGLAAATALSMGLSNADWIERDIGNIKSTLGLDDLSPDATSVLVGKQLSPELYISYVYGFFEQVGTFQIDYQLSKHFSFKASSGEVTAMDLNFNIEAD
jgi:translocation and assembly module TamB